MIDIKAASETIATYQKYGWLLRRIVINGPEGAGLESKLKDIADVPITRSSINAAWFSRPPADGPVAWEIRYLGDMPFALLESLDEKDPDFEHSLSQVEAKLAKAVSAKNAP
ncbi:hypothetical protein BH20ACI2_BH20ACI2_17270 [soil metagenome]